MHILALETSTNRGSLALLADSAVIAQRDLADGRRTAQSFAPALARLLQSVDWDPGSIELVAIANGPGSFTGLRIGVTAAKSFAFATRARLVAVNTLAVIVHRLPMSVRRACAVMDAQRHQLFRATFQRGEDDCWENDLACQIVDRDQIISQLAPTTTLTGPAAEKVPGPLPPGVVLAARTLWHPTATAVGQLAWIAAQRHECDDPFKLVPHYYRPSYAEENSAPRRGDGRG